MVYDRNFEDAYKKLNSEQKKAVDAIDGPVMVIAGPGTGKTQVLTLRIGNILKKTDTAPEQILALTFTESGVAAMRARLADMIGSTAYRVAIHTFHSFANEIIRSHPDQFARIVGSSPLGDYERLEILEEIILETPVIHLRPYNEPLYYQYALGKAFGELKRENVSPEELKDKIRQEEKVFESMPDLYHTKGTYKGVMKGAYAGRKKKLEKNHDLLALYSAYEEKLRMRKRYDFDDMIREVLREFQENRSLLLEVQEAYQYVLADEHQDANRGQNQLLELITSFYDTPNLFIVGDEKQAIFRFQGASLDNFLYFKHRYSSALLVTLTTSYRAVQPLLDAAHMLIGHAPSDEILRIPLISGTGTSRELSQAPLRIGSFQSSVFEEAYIAKDIQRHVESGVALENIAVLYRKNREAEALKRALRQEGIPVVLVSEESVLKNPTVKALMKVLRYLDHFGEDVYLVEVLHTHVFSLNPLDVYKFITYGNMHGQNLQMVLSKQYLLKKAGIEEVEKFLSLGECLTRWMRHSTKESVAQILEMVYRESELLQETLAESDRDSTLSDVRGLLTAAFEYIGNQKGDATLRGFLRFIDLHEQHGLSIKKDGFSPPRHAIRLMTAHKSKGLEFEHVYIVGLVDGHWGNSRDRMHFHLPDVLGSEHDLDDERRLLYVAMTRGKQSVTLTYPRQKEGKELSPSVFLQELSVTPREVIDSTHFEAMYKKEDFFRSSEIIRTFTDEKQYFNDLFLERGLSVTALNNYLECPWQFVYRNLLRVPEVKDKALFYGTAMHETLRYAFDETRKDKTVRDSSVLKILKNALESYPLTPREREESFLKGKKAISGYLKTYRASLGGPGKSEYSVTAALVLPTKESVRLRGTLDRIDYQGEHHVRVIDYKTGKPKSRNEIEGKTKNGTGNYKRQLVFYKLLLMRSDFERRMEEGVIDFVEPDEKGRYHQEVFAITEDEVLELEEVVKRVSKEILDLSFWEKSCDRKECQYCSLRDAVRKAD